MAKLLGETANLSAKLTDVGVVNLQLDDFDTEAAEATTRLREHLMKKKAKAPCQPDEENPRASASYPYPSNLSATEGKATKTENLPSEPTRSMAASNSSTSKRVEKIQLRIKLALSQLKQRQGEQQAEVRAIDQHASVDGAGEEKRQIVLSARIEELEIQNKRVNQQQKSLLEAKPKSGLTDFLPRLKKFHQANNRLTRQSPAKSVLIPRTRLKKNPIGLRVASKD